MSILNPGEGRKESRSTARVKAVVPVEVFALDGIMLLGIGKLYDVGVNCAGIETNVVMTRGHVFHLRFLLEKKYLIDATARVMRISNRAGKRYYGVTFENIDLLHVENLKKFVDKKIKEDPFNDYEKL